MVVLLVLLLPKPVRLEYEEARKNGEETYFVFRESIVPYACL